MIFGRKFNALWFDVMTLTLEAINYAFFLMIVESTASTMRRKGRYRFCVTPDGSHPHSAECNAIYATVAFASVDLLLSFIAGIGITFVLQWDFYAKFKNSRNVQRIQSPGERADEPTGV
jgi:hypothetical protein